MSAQDLLILAASAAVVLLLAGVAAMLGFRQSARIDEGELTRLAAAEGARVEDVALDAGGRGALARLANGKVLVARVMADGISTRLAQPSELRLHMGKRGLRVALADLGFAPLRLTLQGDAPAWLRAIAAART
jgi:hypothetical protein